MEFTTAEKKYIDETPKIIVDAFVLDTELHGTRSVEAQAKLAKSIQVYGETVGTIVMNKKR
jgi:hypothetical protein